jgi:preprotein translocase subunit YajC
MIDFLFWSIVFLSVAWFYLFLLLFRFHRKQLKEESKILERMMKYD